MAICGRLVSTSKFKSADEYKHVTEFPMPMAEFEQMQYEVLREEFDHVEYYLPPTFHPLPPKQFSGGTESPTGWTGGE